MYSSKSIARCLDIWNQLCVTHLRRNFTRWKVRLITSSEKKRVFEKQFRIVTKSAKKDFYSLKPCHVMSLYAWRSSFEQIYYALANKQDELFWTRLKEKFFEFAGKWLENLQSRETLCLHRPNISNIPSGRGWKMLIRRIHCLYKNVIYRL